MGKLTHIKEFNSFDIKESALVDSERINALESLLKSGMGKAAKDAADGIKSKSQVTDNLEKISGSNEALGVLGVTAVLLSGGKAASLVGGFLQHLSRNKTLEKLGVIGPSELEKDSTAISRLGRWMKGAGDDYTHKIEDIISAMLDSVPEPHFRTFLGSLNPKQRRIVDKLVLMGILVSLAGYGGKTAIKAAAEGDLTFAAAEGALTGVKAVEVAEIGASVVNSLATFISASVDVVSDAPDMIDQMVNIAGEIESEP
jgi:hypothetical protein